MAKATWARKQAYKVIQRVSSEQSFARPLVDALIRTDEAAGEASPAERAFAERLALGVAATLGELDLIISRSLGKQRIDPEVRDILRLATYELVFLQKEPYAAVDQAVKLARELRPRASGFVNWALRQVTADAAAFPWGDPADSLEALAHQTAFPLWLAERLTAELGWADAADFMHTSNKPAPTFAQDLISGETLACSSDRLPELQLALEDGSAIIADAAAQQVAGLVAGLVTARLAALAAPGNGSPCRLLEVGSGRGTKTVLINRQVQRWLVEGGVAALHLGDGGADGAAAGWPGLSAGCLAEGSAATGTPELGAGCLAEGGAATDTPVPYEHWAIDVAGFKTDILKQRISQYGLSGVRARTADALNLAAEGSLPDAFDLVFIDAPCSGSGTLRRNLEARWRLTPEAVTQMAEQGRAMLQSLAPSVLSGGCLVYATCSVLREENEALVDAFLASPAGAAFKPLSPYTRTKLEPNGPDAHFAAVLVRR